MAEHNATFATGGPTNFTSWSNQILSLRHRVWRISISSRVFLRVDEEQCDSRLQVRLLGMPINEMRRWREGGRVCGVDCGL